jgi:hypothetical protein
MDGWWVYPVENFRVKDADRRKPRSIILRIPGAKILIPSPLLKNSVAFRRL